MTKNKESMITLLFMKYRFSIASIDLKAPSRRSNPSSYHSTLLSQIAPLDLLVE